MAWPATGKKPTGRIFYWNWPSGRCSIARPGGRPRHHTSLSTGAPPRPGGRHPKKEKKNSLPCSSALFFHPLPSSLLLPLLRRPHRCLDSSEAVRGSAEWPLTAWIRDLGCSYAPLPHLRSCVGGRRVAVSGCCRRRRLRRPPLHTHRLSDSLRQPPVLKAGEGNGVTVSQVLVSPARVSVLGRPGHLEDMLLLDPMVLAEINRQEQAKPHRGSVPGHKVIVRGPEEADARLGTDYFNPDSVYDRRAFRRAYRMRPELFHRITEALTNRFDYFKQRPDAVGQLGCTPRQKVTAAMRMLANGCSAFSLQREVGMGESMILEATKEFTHGVVEIFGDEYLRRPTRADLARLLAKAEQRGFPGMLGCLDCMHWRWEKCPVGWQGYYTGHFKEPTVILEAVADHDLWIWHASFGLPGSLNDINVLHRSHLFDDLLTGRAPSINYTVNGHDYNMGYYLADGIYPAWATLAKGIPIPLTDKHKHFTKLQSAYRKDVERAFGVLQARYHIVKQPARTWHPETMQKIMECCIILHNMTVEDERGLPRPRVEYYDQGTLPQLLGVSTEDLIQRHRRIRCKEAHSNLREDLVEHVWQHVPWRGH